MATWLKFKGCFKGQYLLETFHNKDEYRLVIKAVLKFYKKQILRMAVSLYNTPYGHNNVYERPLLHLLNKIVLVIC